MFYIRLSQKSKVIIPMPIDAINNNYFDILEDVYRSKTELISSKPFRLSLKLYNFYNSIKHGFFIENFKREYNGRRLRKISSKCSIKSDFRYGQYPNDEIRILVYTCITGGYDNPLPPIFDIPNTDYVLLTDAEENVNIEGWQVRQISDDIRQLGNGTLINRYFKMHPSVVGKGYDFAIYIDGNIQVTSNIRNIVNAVSSTTGLAIHRHPSRNCIFDEVKACKILKKGNINQLNKQVAYYKKEGFPQKFGLLECTIIVSDLHNCKSADILDQWWNEFKDSSSFRDQISLPYIIWKNKLSIDDIGNLGYNLRMNPKFRYVVHSNENKYLI